MSDTAEAIAQARKAVEPDKPKHVLRTLGQSIREYKKASILAPVFVTVEGHRQVRRDSAGVLDGFAGCRLPVRKVRGRGRSGLRQEPAQGPVREGAGLQLHQY